MKIPDLTKTVMQRIVSYEKKRIARWLKIFFAVILILLLISLPISFASAISSHNLTYDGNGNLITGNGKYRECNEFNQLVRIRFCKVNYINS